MVSAVLDRMREATPLGQTFSAGVALWNGTETSDDLTARADTALYQAKNAGRNQVVEAAHHPIPGGAAWPGQPLPTAG